MERHHDDGEREASPRLVRRVCVQSVATTGVREIATVVKITPTRDGAMQKQPAKPDNSSTVDSTLAQLREIVEDGLRHGFFECTVSCEIVRDRKRRLVIKAGKSDQFLITEDDVRRR